MLLIRRGRSKSKSMSMSTIKKTREVELLLRLRGSSVFAEV